MPWQMRNARENHNCGAECQAHHPFMDIAAPDDVFADLFNLDTWVETLDEPVSGMDTDTCTDDTCTQSCVGADC
jgi:hypothetical protein